MQTINVLSAVPAAGKTKAILSNIGGKKSIIASLTRQLSTQSYNYYRRECNGFGGVLIDTENTKAHGTVQNAIKNALDSSADVVFITHAALFDLKFDEMDSLEDYDLYIDETPELVDFHRYSFTSTVSELILRYCEPVDTSKRGLQKLILKEDSTESIINNALDGYSGNDDVHKLIFPLYQALLSEIPVMIQFTDESVYCYYINDKTDEGWQRFKSITVAASNFVESFTGQILKNINGWNFEPSPLVEELDFKNYKNTKRINIHVLVDVPWSKHISERLMGTGREQDTVYNKVKSRIFSKVKNEDFIYTSNSYRARLERGFDVPYNPHGLNYYTNYTNAAVLFSYNPLPWQIPLLKELSSISGMDENLLLESYIISKYLEPAFQLCARTNIRDQNSTKVVDLYVPDERLAKYIKSKYFTKATINHSYMLPVSSKVVSNKKPTFQTMFDMTKKEIYRFNYFRRTHHKFDINNPSDVKLVSDWISTQRQKHR